MSSAARAVAADATQAELLQVPRHTPLLARMKPGEVRVKTPTEELSFYVSGGLLEVQPHVVTVLADAAARARDLDEAKVLEAKQRAEEALKDRQSQIDYAKELATLAEAMAQLRAIRRLRDKTK